MFHWLIRIIYKLVLADCSKSFIDYLIILMTSDFQPMYALIIDTTSNILYQYRLIGLLDICFIISILAYWFIEYLFCHIYIG